MKSLHFFMIAIFALFASTIVMADAFAQNSTAYSSSSDLADGNVFHMAAKDLFLPGDLVEVNGNLITTNPIIITLDDPHGEMVASKTTFGDREGYFTSELKIPTNVEAGIWKIVGTSGIYHKELNFTIAGNSNTVTTCYAGNLCSTHVANNTDNVNIVDIHTQPSSIKVGDVFKITATLENNSPDPISVVIDDCEGPFAVTFDNHVMIQNNNFTCAYSLFHQTLNSNETTSKTSPGTTLVYKAVSAGTTNATITFSYYTKNQTDHAQPEIRKTISKSFLFDVQLENNGGPVIEKAQLVSPLKQFKSGIPANDVTCRQGLQLIFKFTNGTPACVTSQTEEKLLERGWVTKISSPNNYAVPTKILSQVFPTNAALSVGEPSVKGYLTSTDGTALSNKQINIIIDNATFENDASIENILVGKTSTDQNGCFYFADWDQDAIDRFQKDMAEKTPHGAPTDLVSIKAVFTGDSKFQGSSNATKFTYYTVAVPIIRPALSAFLVNGSDIVLEREKSYNFTDFSTWGEALQLHALSIEMKNLPCGIYEKTREISVDNNQTQVITPIELRVEKTAPVGNFTTYISVNNQALEPINLEIK